jgi:hypothetical protein
MKSALQDVDPVKIRSLLIYNFTLLCILANLITLVLALDGVIRWSFAFIPGIVLCFVTCIRYIGYIIFETIWDKRVSDFQKFNHRQTGVYICLILGGTGITLSMLGVNLDMELHELGSKGYLVVYGFIPMFVSFVLAGKLIFSCYSHSRVYNDFPLFVGSIYWLSIYIVTYHYLFLH